MPDEAAHELTAHSPRRETLDLPEVAAKLGISRSTAFRHARTGELPAIRIGRRWIVPRAAIDGLLRHGSTDSAEEMQVAELPGDSRASELQQHVLEFAAEHAIELDLSLADPFGEELARSLAELSDDQMEMLWERATGLLKELHRPLNFTALLLFIPLAAERARRT